MTEYEKELTELLEEANMEIRCYRRQLKLAREELSTLRNHLTEFNDLRRLARSICAWTDCK